MKLLLIILKITKIILKLKKCLITPRLHLSMSSCHLEFRKVYPLSDLDLDRTCQREGNRNRHSNKG